MTLPTYGVLWKQVHEWLEHGAFSISLDEVVLTNKNAVSELKEVLGDQHQVSQPSVQLKVAWLPPASSQPEASEQEAAAAETQAPQKEPPRRGAAQLSSLGSLLAGVGLIGALAAMFGLHKVQLQHARTNHEQAVKQNQLLEKSLSESVQNNRALTHKNSQLQDQKEEKEAMIKELLQRKQLDCIMEGVLLQPSVLVNVHHTRVGSLLGSQEDRRTWPDSEAIPGGRSAVHGGLYRVHAALHQPGEADHSLHVRPSQEYISAVETPDGFLRLQRHQRFAAV